MSNCDGKCDYKCSCYDKGYDKGYSNGAYDADDIIVEVEVVPMPLSIEQQTCGGYLATDYNIFGFGDTPHEAQLDFIRKSL